MARAGSATAATGRQFACSRSVNRRPRQPLRLTMLDLIALLQAHDMGHMTEHELVYATRRLINSGRVVLTGSFSNAELPIK